MSLWSRLAGFFRGGSKPAEAEKSGEYTIGPREFSAGFRNGEGVRRGRDWLEQFRWNDNLRTPEHRVAEDASLVRWNLYKEKSDGTRVKVRSHEALDWWSMPSPGELGCWFRYSTIVQLDCTGNCFWRFLDPDDLTAGCVVLQADGPPRLPTSKDPYFYFTINGVTEPIPPREIVWLKRPNPANPLGLGIGFGDAISATLQQLENMARFNNQFFRQGAHMGAVFGIEHATEEAWERFEESFKQNQEGIENAFKSHFITGKVTGLQLAAKHRELDFVEGFEQKRSGVRQVVGTPAEIVGDNRNSNKATSYEAGNFHQTYGMWPRLEVLRLVVNDIVFPKFGIRGYAMDFENPIREKEELQAAKFEAGASRGAVQIDEYRRFLNLDPMQGGDKVYVPLNVVPVTGAELEQVRDAALARKQPQPVQAPTSAPTSENQNGSKSILDKYLEAGSSVSKDS